MTLALPVKHQRQQSNWDCGVTCVRMLIAYYQLDLSSFDRLLESYDCNKSTWTIDLLRLLHQSGIRAVQYTITIGCSTSYDNVPYYSGVIRKDRERVNNLFAQEASSVKLGSIQWSDLKKHLIEQQTPCIVLVDANKLECSICQRNLFESLCQKFAQALSSSYQGHYILVTGFTREGDNEFVRYADPARNSEFCTATQSNFDLARSAFGTDEDIILCYKGDSV